MTHQCIEHLFMSAQEHDNYYQLVNQIDTKGDQEEFNQNNDCGSTCDHNECDPTFYNEEWIEPEGYRKAPKAHKLMEALLVQIQCDGCCDSEKWSGLKLYIYKNPDISNWYSDFYCDDLKMIRTINTPVLLIKYLQRQLMDARFTFRLNQRIEAAKN